MVVDHVGVGVLADLGVVPYLVGGLEGVLVEVLLVLLGVRVFAYGLVGDLLDQDLAYYVVVVLGVGLDEVHDAVPC